MTKINAKRKKPYQLLIVDDHPLVCESLKALFVNYHYKPAVAFSGEEALKKLSQKDNDFDAVLVDICMPKMNGYEMAIKARELFPALPIIGLSGYLHEVQSNDWVHAGMDSIFSKANPISFLHQALQKKIKRYRTELNASA